MLQPRDDDHARLTTQEAAQRPRLATDDSTTQARCLQGSGIDASVKGKTTGRCALLHPVGYLEVCDRGTEVVIASTIAIVVGREHRRADAEVPLHAKTTQRMIWTSVADCPMRYLTFRSWYLTRAFRGKLTVMLSGIEANLLQGFHPIHGRHLPPARTPQQRTCHERSFPRAGCCSQADYRRRLSHRSHGHLWLHEGQSQRTDLRPTRRSEQRSVQWYTTPTYTRLSRLTRTEYADLDPTTAALLVNNAKQTQSQPVQPPAPPFGFNRNMPPFQQAAPNPFTPTAASQPNISNIITSLDSASLTQLLGAMSGNNMPQNQQPPPNFNADLARLLAQVSSPVQTPGYGTTAQPHMPQLGQFPGLASLLANQAQTSAPPIQNPPQTGGAPPDMSEIMAQLAQYQR